jgi:hypothetical protein
LSSLGGDFTHFSGPLKYRLQLTTLYARGRNRTVEAGHTAVSFDFLLQHVESGRMMK